MVVNSHLLVGVLLSFWKVDVSGADVMGMSVLQKGKHCIQAAGEAYETLVKEESDEAATTEVVQHLEILAEDAKYLQKSADHFLDNLLLQEEGLTKRLQELNKDEGQFEMELEKSKKEKTNIEGDRSAKEAVLKDKENQLQRVQKELKDAEDELHRAKKKLKKKSRGLLGSVKKALGKLVGHRSSAEKKVKRAKNNLERQISELKSAQTAASRTQQELSAIQNKINEHKSKVQATQQQVDKIHKEIGSVKSSIVLLRKSVHFWEVFVIACENAEERTVALKSIVDHAAEEREYEFLKEDGTITVAKSFIEAWEIIATDNRIQ